MGAPTPPAAAAAAGRASSPAAAAAAAGGPPEIRVLEVDAYASVQDLIHAAILSNRGAAALKEVRHSVRSNREHSVRSSRARSGAHTACPRAPSVRACPARLAGCCSAQLTCSGRSHLHANNPNSKARRLPARG